MSSHLAMSQGDRLKLATNVYDAVVAATDTLSALAYLLGAIVKDDPDGVLLIPDTTPEDNEFLTILHEAYPDPAHPVWAYVNIETDEAML